MMLETEPRRERRAVAEDIIDALAAGDRVEGRNLWLEWSEQRRRDRPDANTAAYDLESAIDELGFLIADQESSDILKERYLNIEMALGSDASLSNEDRQRLSGKLSRTWVSQ